MAYYTGTVNRPDRAKAIAAVVAVHAALAVVILSGLNVQAVRDVAERLQTIDIRIQPPPPPPEPPPPPAPKPRPAKLEEGAAGKKAEPSPIVAPKPRIPVQSPLPAAPIAGTGNATTAGAATYGTGTGAGGSGYGRGGGGTDGFTPARQLTKIPDREYRRISLVSGLKNGRVALAFDVGPNGRVYNCRIMGSSGNASADSLVCQLATQYLLFSPARDPSGKPIWQNESYSPTWRQNRW